MSMTLDPQGPKPRWNMDVMITRLCEDCAHQWVAPSLTGRCPRCRSEHVSNLESRVNVLRRV